MLANLECIEIAKKRRWNRYYYIFITIIVWYNSRERRYRAPQSTQRPELSRDSIHEHHLLQYFHRNSVQRFRRCWYRHFPKSYRIYYQNCPRQFRHRNLHRTGDETEKNVVMLLSSVIGFIGILLSNQSQAAGAPQSPPPYRSLSRLLSPVDVSDAQWVSKQPGTLYLRHEIIFQSANLRAHMRKTYHRKAVRNIYLQFALLVFDGCIQTANLVFEFVDICHWERNNTLNEAAAANKIQIMRRPIRIFACWNDASRCFIFHSKCPVVRFLTRRG